MYGFLSLNAKQKLISIVVVLIVLVGGIVLWSTQERVSPADDIPDVPNETITSFAECEAAGYPVMESYPRRCAVPSGPTFTEELSEITYDNASADMIRVELPHPGAVVGKEFIVIGQARGNWFFEGSFPLEVRSPSGDILAGTYATAEGDWMTTDFVSFRSEMFDLPSAYIGPATLILRKDNPSGLPEHDASISFPIVVEY